jgi:hypothetical protein
MTSVRRKDFSLGMIAGFLAASLFGAGVVYGQSASGIPPRTSTGAIAPEPLDANGYNVQVTDGEPMVPNYQGLIATSQQNRHVLEQILATDRMIVLELEMERSPGPQKPIHGLDDILKEFGDVR